MRRNMYPKGLAEWFYPEAKRLSKAIRGYEKDWPGRIPILVESAWVIQQLKIEKLKEKVKILQEELKEMEYDA